MLWICDGRESRRNIPIDVTDGTQTCLFGRTVRGSKYVEHGRQNVEGQVLATSVGIEATRQVTTSERAVSSSRHCIPGMLSQPQHVRRPRAKHGARMVHGFIIVTTKSSFYSRLKNIICEYDRLNG